MPPRDSPSTPKGLLSGSGRAEAPKRRRGFKDVKKPEIISFCTKNGYRPSQTSKDPVEKKLGQSLGYYLYNSSYDADFAAKIEKWPTLEEFKRNKQQQEIVLFCKKNGYRPSQISKDPVEKKLGQALNRYTTENHTSHDSDFAAKIKQWTTKQEFVHGTTDNKKQEIVSFCAKNGHRPSKTSKDPVEKKLGEALSQYLSKNRKSYDAEFAAKIEKWPTWAEFKKSKPPELNLLAS